MIIGYFLIDFELGVILEILLWHNQIGTKALFTDNYYIFV